MRLNLTFLFSVLLVCCLGTAQADGPLELDLPEGMSVLLYAHGEHGPHTDGVDLTRFRGRVTYEPEHGLGFRIHLEGGALDEDGSGNWVNEARVSYTFADGTIMRVGRSFNPALCQAPAPHLLRTARFPRVYDPYGDYRNGLELEKHFGKLKLAAGIGGPAGRRFDDKTNFNFVEGSVHLKQKIGRGFWTLSSQLSEFNQGGGVTVGGTYGRLTTTGGVTYSDKNHRPEGFGYLEWRVSKIFRPHVQLEAIEVPGTNGDTKRKFVPLAGMGLEFGKHVYGVVDYDFDIDDVQARLQLRLY